MIQLLRTHGGYAGWSDDALLDMSYARFLQASRVAGEAAARDAKGQMKAAAFIGYQQAMSWGALRKGTTFQGYLRSIGMGESAPRMTQEQREAEIKTARENAERVRVAFMKRGVA